MAPLVARAAHPARINLTISVFALCGHVVVCFAFLPLWLLFRRSDGQSREELHLKSLLSGDWKQHLGLLKFDLSCLIGGIGHFVSSGIERVYKKLDAGPRRHAEERFTCM